MNIPAKLLARTCAFACILFVGIACNDKDEFFETGKEGTTDKPVETKANTFDFSTTQDVELIVDYSDFNAKIPVFFSVYNVNPFVNENTNAEFIDENINPLFSGYTDSNGKFEETITLPTYAKRLHIVTGNFLVGLRRNMAVIENGHASVIVEDQLHKSNKKNSRRLVSGKGTSTNDLSGMKHLYLTSSKTQVYKPWSTPLGTWNSASGRPDYLLDSDDPELIAKGLVFTEDEFTGMYGTACDALNSGTNLKEQYRAASDMTLIRDSEVSITALGSSTCWNSSLGYYYYTGDAPTDKMDLNIIMIFPNTQDGEWPRGSYPNNNYNGNIGTLRGDAVQLMYYPPKDDGSLDFDNGTTIFPQGTKIGFMLKTNAWGQRGVGEYAVNGSAYAGKKNIWASTTDGLSSALDSGVKYPNTNGEARSAKFAYTAPNGNKYVVVSFEDACDDKDYDDLMFALNPANAFDFGDTPQIESRRVTTEGVYAFEDQWPRKGDFDMNDMVIGVKHELEFYTHTDGSNKLNKERFYLTPTYNYIEFTNGLAVDVQGSDIATIYVNKLVGNETTFASTNYKMYNKKYYYLEEFQWDKNQPRMWYLVEDIKPLKKDTVTYVFEITYTKAVKKGQTTIRPFLWRKLDNGKHLEVHLPWVEPTNKMDQTLFGTADDRSDPTIKRSNGQKMYYVGESEYPFAFYLEGVTLKDFKNTLLSSLYETMPIDQLFPDFLEWSKSNGAKKEGWYLNPEPPAIEENQ